MIIRPNLRMAMEADLTAINDIYNFYVLGSTCTYQLEPESIADRTAWFREHLPDKYPVTVVEMNGNVVGWGSLPRFRPRAALAQTVEVTVYIDHRFHRQGLGKLILSDLIDRARAIGYHSAIASVSAEQAPSLALHESFGFRCVAHMVEVGIKFGQQLDLKYLQLML